MENANVAFICPLYDMKNHFELAINLCKSKIKYQIYADLIFIFSNEDQKDKFAKLLSKECPGEKLMYDIIPADLEKYKAKAVVKKLYGLERYKNEYEYIIVTDCEAEFIRNFNVNEVANNIWETRSMLSSNISAKGFFIMRECYKAMGLYYNKKLRKALGNYKYNFWFNEMQVYKCDVLHGFFEWLEEFDKEKIYNTWSCFEYYVFYAYLCLRLDMVDISKKRYVSLGCVNESLYLYNIKKQKKILKDLQVHWTTSKDIKSEKICMLFHLDRMHNYYEKLDLLNFKIFRIMIILLRRIMCIIQENILFIKRYFILLMELPEYIYNLKHR